MNNFIIAPSIIASDFTHIADEIAICESAGASWLHVDVMDGHFVPTITIGPLFAEACKRVTKLPLDVPLMIENPEKHLEAFDIKTIDTNFEHRIRFVKSRFGLGDECEPGVLWPIIHARNDRSGKRDSREIGRCESNRASRSRWRHFYQDIASDESGRRECLCNRQRRFQTSRRSKRGD
jgi:hypothetical protein